MYDLLRFIVYRRQTFKMFGIPSSREIRRKMAEAYQRYGWYPDEFFLYHYDSLTDEERRSFIGEKEHGMIAETMNSEESVKILSDKWETYCTFNEYFNRKAILIEGVKKNCQKKEAERLLCFLKEKGRLIIKPRLGSFGRGVRIITADKITEKDIIKMIANYPKGIIAEEVIVQAESLAVLHPESVNTLRIHTICYNKEVEILHPYLRIGRQKSCVDNAANGGVFTSCNLETGEILSVVDEYGHTFTKHPDNGVPIVGYTIPYWEEAFGQAKLLALHLPGLHYAGWDLALTKDGWVLVEGNPCAQMVFQISEQKGFREELEGILQKYNVVISKTKK